MEKSIQHQETELIFGQDLSEKINQVLISNFKDCKKIIITDDNVFDLWAENLISSIEELHHAEIIQLPAGEGNKTIEICFQVWETLSDYKIGRNDVIINFGGGVITDMGGFIASTFKRGLKFINIPTTLLSQVDASIGGKTGVDLGPLKNQIGVFSNPEYVFIDYKYLQTLKQIELTSGFAEMLKHGLIFDKTHWSKLSMVNSVKPENISELIFDSVNIKHQIVLEDPKEKNIRKSLNFGHTIGHSFEGYLLSKKETVPHGFAVAWGMIVESKLAHELGKISKTEFIEISTLLSKHYGVCPISKSDIHELLALMKNDKKNRSEEINFSLLNGIGKFVINIEIPINLIEQTLHNYLQD
jgi:3-dehydroquinate synthase